MPRAAEAVAHCKAAQQISPWITAVQKPTVFKDEKPVRGHYEFNQNILDGIPKLDWSRFGLITLVKNA